MQNLLRAAHADIAAQLAPDHEPSFAPGALRRLMAAGLSGIALSVAGQQAYAADTSTFTALIGGAIGTMAGAAATHHQSDYTIRAAAMLAAGTAGTWAGKEIGQRMDAPPQREQDNYRGHPVRESSYRAQPEREVVYVREEAPLVREYVREEVPRVRESARAAPGGWQDRGQAQSELLFSPEEVGFSPILCAALEHSQMRLVGAGQKDLSGNPVLKARLVKVAADLVASGAAYGRQIDQWDDAATLVGSQGLAARTSAADHLTAARRDLDARAADYAQVRNVLAQKGYDVAPVDRLVSERTAQLAEPERYVFSDARAARPR